MSEYPTKAELDEIRNWGGDFEFISLMEFIQGIWKYVDMGYFKRKGRTFWLSTAGWSGNESIINAMEENKHLFWFMNWESSKRGGHYKFRIRKVKKSKKETR